MGSVGRACSVWSAATQSLTCRRGSRAPSARRIVPASPRPPLVRLLVAAAPSLLGTSVALKQLAGLGLVLPLVGLGHGYRDGGNEETDGRRRGVGRPQVLVDEELLWHSQQGAKVEARLLRQDEHDATVGFRGLGSIDGITERIATGLRGEGVHLHSACGGVTGEGQGAGVFIFNFVIVVVVVFIRLAIVVVLVVVHMTGALADIMAIPEEEKRSRRGRRRGRVQSLGGSQMRSPYYSSTQQGEDAVVTTHAVILRWVLADRCDPVLLRSSW